MMKNIKAVIIDDEQDAIDYLKGLLSGFPEIEICAEISDTARAVNLILDHRPDVIFLDIQMPGKGGMDIIKELHHYDQDIPVIFTTAFDKYAIESLKHSAFDYLLKPVDPEELQLTFTRLKAATIRKANDKRMETLFHGLTLNKKLRFNTRTGFILINTSDIIYIESDRNYSTIYLKDGMKEVITTNIGTVKKILPLQFVRISRFHVINSEYLLKVDRKRKVCVLNNEESLYEFKTNSKMIKSFDNIPLG